MISEFIMRIQRLQARLQEKRIDGCMITQNVDIYYFAGSMQSGYLFVPSAGEALFFVRRSVVRAQGEAAVQVEPLGSFRSFGDRLADTYRAIFDDAASSSRKLRLAAEFDVLPVQQLQRLEAVLPGAEWVDGSMLIRELRMIKSAAELACIREAARVIDLAFNDAVQTLRPGTTELELMSRIELFIRRQGHLGIMRMRGYNQEVITGMVGAGEAAAMPTYFDGPAGGQGLSAASPQSAGRRPIQPNEPILIDIGCCIEGYVIDQTRTAVIGTLQDELVFAYDTSEQIIRSVEERLKPGTICEQLYMHSLQMAHKAGLSDHFMGYGDDQVKFLGHGIGLEIDELPVLAKGFSYPLQPGMVIAIEPKFTFPGRGVVGIENSYVITENGYEKLTVTQEGLIVL
ncbi:M24 family metallopeptidase [Paenibacillus radicis (ex Xue et al. 2023)]|uniref:Xaa-Pro peptidase family protein n=1 Tax=Paenibacillus radicis (ex Xue et al. 2023) TaxID=2972489 RepID=A0ABT1YU81_9BACL|nr:Xaa-Pro peptidase family protein [Paenibacillus radicis (ex Xue et al. 2023)]MCR8635848.1 Xaa-Pro peptidase family protein [Paenibacillus radicis (ex Xue et al. 2023)]